VDRAPAARDTAKLARCAALEAVIEGRWRTIAVAG